MWTAVFWKGAAERAIKTLAQTMLALWFVGDRMMNVYEVDWMTSLGVGAGALVGSLLTSLISAGMGPEGTPSLVEDRPSYTDQ